MYSRWQQPFAVVRQHLSESRPCWYSYCMQQKSKGNKEIISTRYAVRYLFKMFGIPEVQRAGKRVITDIPVAAFGDAVLIFVKDREKQVLAQDALF